MGEFPEHLKYAETHEWAAPQADGAVRVGITEYAQRQLGDVVFVDLPAVGGRVKAGEECAAIESVKSASGLHAPVSGEICAVNSVVKDAPEQVNEAPYATWLFAVRPDNPAELDALLTADGYRLRHK
jgi:glycine cleavage system H protein